MPAMDAKKKNIIEEPAEVYEVTPNSEITSIGFDVLGNEINHKEFIEDIENALFDLKNGNLKFKSVADIRK
jgi:hypothetical protein